MDFRIFAESLTITEINELSNILWEMKREFAKKYILPLEEPEKQLVKNGEYIQAIKLYRERLGSSLLEAKIAVDTFRETLIKG